LPICARETLYHFRILKLSNLFISYIKEGIYPKVKAILKEEGTIR
jgi:hypothetical protein